MQCMTGEVKHCTRGNIGWCKGTSAAAAGGVHTASDRCAPPNHGHVHTKWMPTGQTCEIAAIRHEHTHPAIVRCSSSQTHLVSASPLSL
eukprot:scaffold226492_cov18-Tisochrysis_lutea.AAC.1